MAIILCLVMGLMYTMGSLATRDQTVAQYVAGPSRKITDLGISSAILQFIVQVHRILLVSSEVPKSCVQKQASRQPLLCHTIVHRTQIET